MTGPKIRTITSSAARTERAAQKILSPRGTPLAARPAFTPDELKYGYTDSARYGGDKAQIVHLTYRVKYKGWVTLCRASSIAKLADMDFLSVDARRCGSCLKSFNALFPETNLP